MDCNWNLRIALSVDEILSHQNLGVQLHVYLSYYVPRLSSKSRNIFWTEVNDEIEARNSFSLRFLFRFRQLHNLFRTLAPLSMWRFLKDIDAFRYLSVIPGNYIIGRFNPISCVRLVTGCRVAQGFNGKNLRLCLMAIPGDRAMELIEPQFHPVIYIYIFEKNKRKSARRYGGANRQEMKVIWSSSPKATQG